MEELRPMDEGVLVPQPKMELQEKEYYPPKGQTLKEYEVRINFHDVGMTIHVGCRSVAFSNVEDGMKALNEYIANPNEKQRYWRELFNKN